MNILPYTFRTTTFINQLKEFFLGIFVFGKLNSDFEEFKSLIALKQPAYILGIATSPFKFSQFETTAINRFHKKNKVSKTGQSQFKLFVPNLNNTVFRISKNPSDSFCNWTMYKISNFIKQNNLNTKLMFVHLRSKDLNSLTEIVSTLQ